VYILQESEKFQTIVVFEGRGLEPVEFDPRGGWTAVGVDSGTEFLDVDLSQKVGAKSNYISCSCNQL
jgi:hypothetical protein